MRGERTDLRTPDGQRKAMLDGLKSRRSPKAYHFTNQDRERGQVTQRNAGRFGKGRFR